MRRLLAGLSGTVVVVALMAPAAQAGDDIRCEEVGVFKESVLPFGPGEEAWVVEGETIDGDLVVGPEIYCQIVDTTVTGGATVADGAVALFVLGSEITGTATVGRDAGISIFPDFTDDSVPPESGLTEYPPSTIGGSVIAQDNAFIAEVVGSSVNGDVSVGRDAFGVVVASEVGGDYECLRCLYIDLIGGLIDGDVSVEKGVDGGFVEPFEEESTFIASEIGGDFSLVKSDSETFEHRLVGTTVDGNVHVEKNRLALLMAENTLGGDVTIEKNTFAGISDSFQECIPADVPPGELPPFFEPVLDAETGEQATCELFAEEGEEFGLLWQATIEIDPAVLAANEVDGSLIVNKNQGQAVQITDNTVGGTLTCDRNRPAPVGGGNTVDGDREGQCGTL